MWQIRFVAPASDREILDESLYESELEGVAERDLDERNIEITVFFGTREQAESAAARLAAYSPEIVRSEDVDWVAVSRENWEPLAIGARLFLAPDWRDDPTPAGRIRVPARAGRACGSGAHPCTQMCLGALDRLVSGGSAVLDAGTGSGLLSVAAVRLGAKRVIAFDNDPEAVEVAREYIRADGADVPLFVGQVESVRPGTSDIVVANISAPVCAGSAEQWGAALRPSGWAVLSGFERHEAETVRHAMQRAGLRINEELEDSGWVCLIGQRP